MTSTDEWLAYLDAARAFHRYSPQNQMLLALQGAEGYVASYRNWTRIPATDGGTCQVAKGEKGLAILAPMISKSVEVDDDTGEETSRKRLRGFRTVQVFHQGQLVSPPAIPEPQMPELLTGPNRWQHVWSAVVGQLEDDGYTVALHSRSPIEKWNGMTTWGERSVKVADDLEPPQRIKTLLHEWAHVQLGHEHRLTGDRDVKEVEAESVAYLLSQTIGLDSQSYSIPYVTGWAGGDAELVQSTAEAVLTTTKRLVDILESDLGIELTPDALDHATPVGGDNVTALPNQEPQPAEVTTPASVAHVDQQSLPIDEIPSQRSARPGLDPATMTDAEFVLAVKERLEPEPARRLMSIVYEPDNAGEAGGELAGLGWGDAPVDDVAAVDVDDHEQLVVLAAVRALQLRDIPTPHPVRSGGDQLGFLLRRVRALAASLAVLASDPQQAVHGRDRTQIDAVIEQPRPDLSRCEITELRRAQHPQDVLLLGFGELVRRRRPRRRRAQFGWSATPVVRGTRLAEQATCSLGRRGRGEVIEVGVDHCLYFGSIAVLMAEAGITASQTARVLRHLGVDDAKIRIALSTPMPHDAERPNLWTTEEVDVALGVEVAATAESRIERVEANANHDLIVQTYRTAEPARVAALAYGLGVECPDVIRMCVNSRPDPTAAFEIAVSMHPGDTGAAIAELRKTWPNPPGGWDAYLPTTAPVLPAASAEVDDYASTQAILDEWYGLDTVASPPPAPEHSIT